MEYEQNTPQAVNPAFAIYDSMTPGELIIQMNALEEKIDAHEARAKPDKAAYEFLRLIKIPQVFDEQGIKNQTVVLVAADGALVTKRCGLTSDVYASVVSGRTQEAFGWMRDNGREGLIKETVNASTLKAAAKAALVKGEPFPEDFFKVTPYSRATLTKVS